MADGGRPSLSVVIPTHNRRAALLRTLAALAAQTLPADRFDVTVVTDACTDDTITALDTQVFPFALSHLPSDGRGASAARNTGARSAHAERIVFLDDDIVADPGFLAAIVAAAAAHPDAAIVGQSAPATVATGWFGRAVTDWWAGRFREMAAPGYRFGHTDIMSGNLSIPRSTFWDLGGFDQALLCREDYELGFRMVGAGVPIVYAANARGLHHDATTPQRNLHRAANEGAADFQIGCKHPELFTWLKSANMTSQTTGATILRTLAFSFPVVARAGLATTSAMLPVLERLHLHRAWCQLSAHARTLSYHLGVAAAAGNVGSLRDAARAGASSGTAPVVADIDLLDGIDAAREAIRANPPDQLSLRMGDRLLAQFPAEPGKERQGPRHLEALLRTHVGHWSIAEHAAKLLPTLPQSEPHWASSTADSCVGIAEIDLCDWSLREQTADIGYPLRTLVRQGPHPLGWLYLDAPPAHGQFWQTIRRKVLENWDIGQRLFRLARLPPPPRGDAVPISVVVCTRDRTDTLRRCLSALCALEYPAFEIIVIDNSPTSDATARLVATMSGVRYVREDRPGLDWARNRGIAEATHAIVAFTDDDTAADKHWLSGYAEAFAEPAVQFATGLVLPMKLDTSARLYFEDIYGGMGKGFDASTRDPKVMWPHDILWSSALGVGANMAFRKSMFSMTGPFDPALDVGTATRGGGDIEMFHRALARGCVHVYQPSAMVWHEHREDFDGIARQLTDNGSGFAAYLLAAMRNRTVPRMAVIRFAARSWVWDWLVKRLIRPGRHRRAFVRAEITGMLRGPRVWREAQARAAELAAGTTAAAEGTDRP